MNDEDEMGDFDMNDIASISSMSLKKPVDKQPSPKNRNMKNEMDYNQMNYKKVSPKRGDKSSRDNSPKQKKKNYDDENYSYANNMNKKEANIPMKNNVPRSEYVEINNKRKPMAFDDEDNFSNLSKFNNNSISLVSFNIKTGRKHQIRSQSSLHGHPLLGDTAYHGHSIHHLKRDFYLHAGELYFPDNNLGIPSVLKAPLDDDFYNFLNYCGIEKFDI